jgi:hypothetical protein
VSHVFLERYIVYRCFLYTVLNENLLIFFLAAEAHLTLFGIRTFKFHLFAFDLKKMSKMTTW